MRDISVKKTAEKYFLRARLKYKKDPKFTTQINELKGLLDKGLYIDFFTKFNTSFGLLDAEEAQHHFNSSPLTSYAGTKDGLICSYIKTGATIRRRENELGEGAFGRVKKTMTPQEQIPTASAVKRVKLEPTNTFKHKTKNTSRYTKESLFNQLLADAKDDLSKREQALQAKIDEKKVFDQTAKKQVSPQLAAETKQLQNEKELLSDWEKTKNHEAVINTYYSLFKLKKEATINIDLNLALSDLIIRRNENGTPYKAYLNMHYYEQSLPEAIKAITAEDDPTRENYTIDALLSLMEIHNGEASLSQKHYAHLDIKPSNIRVDKKGKIHFIDFGFAKRNELEREFTASSGTPIYMPRNYDKNVTYKYLNLLTSFKSLEPLKVIEVKNAEKDISQSISNYTFNPNQKMPNPFMNDIIALLRVIWHPWSLVEKMKIFSIYSYDAFKRLPISIQEILDTSDINRCVSFFSKTKHPLRFLASLFILYQQDPKSCTKEKIERLLINPHEQERLISPHLKRRNKENIILTQYTGVNFTKIQPGENPFDKKGLFKHINDQTKVIDVAIALAKTRPDLLKLYLKLDEALLSAVSSSEECLKTLSKLNILNENDIANIIYQKNHKNWVYLPNETLVSLLNETNPTITFPKIRKSISDSTVSKKHHQKYISLVRNFYDILLINVEDKHFKLPEQLQNPEVAYLYISDPSNIPDKSFLKFNKNALIPLVLEKIIPFENLKNWSCDQETSHYIELAHYTGIDFTKQIDSTQHIQVDDQSKKLAVIQALTHIKPDLLTEERFSNEDLKKALIEKDSAPRYESLSKNSFLNPNKIQTSSSTSRLLTSKEEKDKAIKKQICNFNLAIANHEGADEKNKEERLADIKRSFSSLCKVVSQRRNRLFSTALPHCLFSLPESEKQLINYLMMEGQAKLKKLLNLPDEKEKLIRRIEEGESINPTQQ